MKHGHCPSVSESQRQTSGQSSFPCVAAQPPPPILCRWLLLFYGHLLMIAVISAILPSSASSLWPCNSAMHNPLPCWVLRLALPMGWQQMWCRGRLEWLGFPCCSFCSGHMRSHAPAWSWASRSWTELPSQQGKVLVYQAAASWPLDMGVSTANIIEAAPPDFSIRSKPCLQELNCTGLPGWFLFVPLKSCGFSSPSIIAPTENECNFPPSLYCFKLPISWSSLPTALKHTQLFFSFYALMLHLPSTSFYLWVSLCFHCWPRDSKAQSRISACSRRSNQPERSESKADTGGAETLLWDSWILCNQQIMKIFNKISSVQFSRSVMSDSLRPHGLQHTRLPCPSPTPGVYTNSYPLSQWCHPTISSSVIPFSSCLKCFPASGSFPMSQFFSSSGQSIGVSASTSVLPMNTQDWSPLGWTGWISL